MISFLPSARIPSATRTGRFSAPAPVLRASTTPSEHERLVALGKRARMEGGDGFIQGLGNPAHGRGRDLAAEQGQQDLAHLAG